MSPHSPQPSVVSYDGGAANAAVDRSTLNDVPEAKQCPAAQPLNPLNPKQERRKKSTSRAKLVVLSFPERDLPAESLPKRCQGNSVALSTWKTYQRCFVRGIFEAILFKTTWVFLFPRGVPSLAAWAEQVLASVHRQEIHGFSEQLVRAFSGTMSV